MNNKIKDIALECMVRYINDGDAWTFTTQELEKFAREILLECADRIDVGPDNDVFTDPTFNKGYICGRGDAASQLRDFL